MIKDPEYLSSLCKQLVNLANNIKEQKVALLEYVETTGTKSVTTETGFKQQPDGTLTIKVIIRP